MLSRNIFVIAGVAAGGLSCNLLTMLPSREYQVGRSASGNGCQTKRQECLTPCLPDALKSVPEMLLKTETVHPGTPKNRSWRRHTLWLVLRCLVVLSVLPIERISSP